MKKSMILKILGIVVTIVMLLETPSVFAANINELNNQLESVKSSLIGSENTYYGILL